MGLFIHVAIFGLRLVPSIKNELPTDTWLLLGSLVMAFGGYFTAKFLIRGFNALPNYADQS